jgi:hypothetical protein
MHGQNLASRTRAGVLAVTQREIFSPFRRRWLCRSRVPCAVAMPDRRNIGRPEEDRDVLGKFLPDGDRLDIEDSRRAR